MAKSIGTADVTLTPNKRLTGIYALCYVASLTEYTVTCKETNDTFSLYATIENPYLSFLKINLKLTSSSSTQLELFIYSFYHLI